MYVFFVLSSVASSEFALGQRASYRTEVWYQQEET